MLKHPYMVGSAMIAGTLALIWASTAKAEIVRVPNGIVCAAQADIEAMWNIGNTDVSLDMEAAATAVNQKLGHESCKRAAFILEVGPKVGEVSRGESHGDIHKLTIYATCGGGFCIYSKPEDAYGVLVAEGHNI